MRRALRAVVLSLSALVVCASGVSQTPAHAGDGAVEREPLQEAAPAAVTAAVVPPSPAALAIRARLADHRDRTMLATADEMTAVGAFFDARAGATVFADAHGLTPRATAVLAELGRADEWGLPSSELVPAKIPVNATALNEFEIADAEVRLSLAALKYARYARGGRIPEPAKQLATYLDRSPQLIEPKVVLETIATANDAGEALGGFNPRHPEFQALRKAYNAARLAKSQGSEPAGFPAGPSLKPDMRHPQVALLRERLKVAVPAINGVAGDPALYDETLMAAVAAFQEANGLEPADGIVGGKTRAALNSLNPPSARRLSANMEQWRWMPDDLGATRIVVNIPEFTVRMIANNSVIHAERVVTGLVTNQTPVFSDMLATVVLQPDWVLPESIKINEALPSLRGGGGMFWSNGLKIKRGTADIDPSAVNWSTANLKAYTFYQPPGEANVLGQVKFLFPNKHAVYMHDTPAKHLFDNAVRAYSHGCMRVRNPVKLAELVLMADKGWPSEKVAQLLEDGPEDNKIALDHKIPVHVTYFTAVPDDKGGIRSLPDIYGHEERISLALEGRWGEIDIPPDHLAPVEDREFEDRPASAERRRARDGDNDDAPVQDKGGDPFGKAIKSIFGGF